MISKGPGLGLVRHNALPAGMWMRMILLCMDMYVCMYACVRCMHMGMCACMRMRAYVHVTCMYVVGVMPYLLRLARDL